jgi:hypothetical protein
MSKKQEAVPATAAPTSEDSAYQALVQRAVDVTRSLAVSEIEWYWRIGEVFQAFTDAKEKRQVGVRTVAQFAADMAADGFSIGESTLFRAKAIYGRYKFETITEMVSSGMRIGHLNLIQGFEGEQLAAIQRKMRMPDGKIITIEALNDEINKQRRVTAAPANQAMVSDAASKDTVTVISSDGDMFTVSAESIEQPTHGVGTASMAVPAVPDDGKTGSRGLTPEKEFSVASPLKALKDVDKAASKLSGYLSDAYIAVNEAVKIGFDSDRSQANFKEAFANAKAALQEVLAPAQKLLETMNGLEGDL